MKICASCGLLKSVESFYTRSADRPHSYCKPCAKEKARVRYLRVRSDPAFKQRAYERQLSYRKQAEPGDRDRLFASQGGKCALCDKPESENSKGLKRLAVDHDHKTGRVRGLLCDNCNRGLGLLRDDLSILTRAISYIQANCG